ncbi:hypothetical protein NL676_017862 [Syzygium grande]|nr:hypothetical protein NL676_017862 [Syzygium grande]
MQTATTRSGSSSSSNGGSSSSLLKKLKRHVGGKSLRRDRYCPEERFAELPRDSGAAGRVGVRIEGSVRVWAVARTARLPP